MTTKSYLKIDNLPLFFLIGRLVILIALPMEGLKGFGDLVHFYRLAGMGIPFIDYWVEFPPIFPFFSALLFNIAGGREHIYDYLLVIILSLAQALSLAIFIRLIKNLYTQIQARKRSLLYFGILLILSYGWWYFDPLAELLIMLALYWLIGGKDIRAGIAIGVGTLVKFFPIFILPLVWRVRSFRRAMTISAISMGIIFVIYGGLYLFAPEMTIASIRSQSSKGSWETVWALVDGNFNTGNFGPESERFDPETATVLRGNLAKIPTWMTLIPFLILGFWAFWKVQLSDAQKWIAFLGLTWGLFLVWSPGWSPQWVLYLIPILLLTLHEREAVLLSLSLIFINLLEWPVMLSRGYTSGLWLTIPVRTLLFLLLIFLMFRIVSGTQSNNINQVTI